MEAGHHQSAIPRLQGVLEQAPNNHDARETLALALGSAGRAAEASEQLSLVREARAALARAKHLVRKVPLTPRNADVRSEIGRINLKYGDAQLGLDWLQSALSFDPNHQATLHALVEFYERSEKTSAQSQRLADEVRTRLEA